MNKVLNNILQEGVFIVHALNGYRYHEERIKILFKQQGIKYEFVTDGDPSCMNQDVFKSTFDESVLSKFSIGGISCTLNHFYAYKRMLDKGLKYAIVFENDPCFLGDFKNQLAKIFNELEDLESGFIVSLENSTLRFPSVWTTKRNKYLYRANSGRMAGAYIIDAVAAQKIIDDLKLNKCNKIIDIWHNNLIDRGIIKMYWAHPALIEQGSHNGTMSSTISSKKNSLKRKLIWATLKYYKMSIKRLFPEKRIIES
nr:glycosyltransferase family 25 protein [uncultured Carboxylicivirga sp.]